MNVAKHNFPSSTLDGVVDRAGAIYEGRGLKFTILRRLVLEVLAERSTPVGAYTIIHVLEERYRKLSPISVYRALDSLISLGIVRKLKTRNAYFVAESFWARSKQRNEKRVFLICDICDRVTEAASPAAYDLIEQASRSALFRLTVNAIEVSGVCDSCREAHGRKAGARLRPTVTAGGARAQKISAR